MTSIVKNDYGVDIDFAAAVAMMDAEICEDLHYKIAPCTNQAFFDAYCVEHREKFGEEFEFTKKNPAA